LLVLQQFDKIGAELAIIGLRSMTTPIIGSQKPKAAFRCGQSARMRAERRVSSNLPFHIFELWPESPQP
jgi:hypothetical protein